MDTNAEATTNVTVLASRARDALSGMFGTEAWLYPPGVRSGPASDGGSDWYLMQLTVSPSS